MACFKQLTAALIVAILMASNSNAENIVIGSEEHPHVEMTKPIIEAPGTNHSIPAPINVPSIPIEQIEKKEDHPPPSPPPLPPTTPISPSGAPPPKSPTMMIIKQGQKHTAKERRTMHYLIHSTLESELMDLLGSAYDESMIFHEDVSEIQKCIGKPMMESFYGCLNKIEENSKKFNEQHPHPHNEHPTTQTTEQINKETIEFDSMLDHTLHQCFTPIESKHVKECFHDQEFNIIDENMDLIDEHFDELYGGESEDDYEEELDHSHNSSQDFDGLHELERLQHMENIERMKNVEQHEREREQTLHHGSFDNSRNHFNDHYDHHNHEYNDANHKEENLKLKEKLNQLELINSNLKPTKSTFIDEPIHHNPDENQNHPNSPHPAHLLEKRRYGYGPDWQTLVGKRDVHPLP